MKYIFLITARIKGEDRNLFWATPKKKFSVSDVTSLIETHRCIILNTQLLGRYSGETIGLVDTTLKVDMSKLELVKYTACRDCALGNIDNSCTVSHERTKGIISCGSGMFAVKQ